MKTYEFGLKHDDGMVNIRVHAEDLAEARKIALDIEKAPENAIRWWRVVPTQKQIQKTKNLMRGI